MWWCVDISWQSGKCIYFYQSCYCNSHWLHWQDGHPWRHWHSYTSLVGVYGHIRQGRFQLWNQGGTCWRNDILHRFYYPWSRIIFAKGLWKMEKKGWSKGKLWLWTPLRLARVDTSNSSIDETDGIARSHQFQILYGLQQFFTNWWFGYV